MIGTADAVMMLYERNPTPPLASFDESVNQLKKAPEAAIRDAIAGGRLAVYFFDANGIKRSMTPEHWSRWCGDQIRSIFTGVFIGQRISTDAERQTCHGVSIFFDADDWKRFLGERPVASRADIERWTVEFEIGHPDATRDEMEREAIKRFGPGIRDTVRALRTRKKRGRKPRQIVK